MTALQRQVDVGIWRQYSAELKVWRRLDDARGHWIDVGGLTYGYSGHEELTHVGKMY